MMQDDKVRDAVLKVALGFQVEEVTEEYDARDGELKLVKRRETRKDIPPDLKAVRLLLEGTDYSALSDEELEAEREKLIGALAAEQKAAGADILYVPAGWAAGPNKLLHWRTLLCARAIENHMTVLGVDQSAPGCFIGHSAVFAPDGTTRGALGEGDGLLTITI